MKALSYFALVVILSGGSLLMAACSLLDSESSDGSLTLLLTDAPFPYDLVEEANVTISRVEIVGEDSAPSPILEEVRSYNLLDLRDGVTTVLGEVDLPAGKYPQIRMIVDEAEIKLVDGTTFDLFVPSGAETGLKILLPNFEIVADQETELTLDFDVSRSFIPQGSIETAAGIQGFIFTPVVIPIGLQEEQAE